MLIVKAVSRSLSRFSIFPYLALLPAIAFLLVVMIYPSIDLIFTSFQDYRLGGESSFVGLNNYIYIFTDPLFWKSLANTLYFSFWSLSIEMVISLGLAMTFSKALKGIGFFRGVMLLPWMMSSAVCSVIWAWLFEGSYGLVNYLLLSAGIISQPIVWLSTPGLSMWVIIWIDIWRETPIVTMMLVAGLQSISNEVYEAARIDGANWWQQFLRITLPLLRPAILLALILRTMIVLRVYDTVAILTAGGPAGTTEVLGTYIHKAGFSSFRFDRAAAASAILLILTLLISLIYVKFLPKEEV